MQTKTKRTFAHAVPRERVDEDRYVVDRLAKDIAWLGHSRVIPKSDDEPAMLNLLGEVLKESRVNGVTSNGATLGGV